MTDAASPLSGSGSIMNTIVDHCATGITRRQRRTDAALTIENCTIDHNTVSGRAGRTGRPTSPSLSSTTSSPTTAEYGVIQQRTSRRSASPIATSGTTAASNFVGLAAGTGSISADPLYVGATDYHLQAGSVAIDTGTPVGAPGQDFDLHPRPQDGDGVNGAQFDMGAYEIRPPGQPRRGDEHGRRRGFERGRSGWTRWGCRRERGRGGGRGRRRCGYVRRGRRRRHVRLWWQRRHIRLWRQRRYVWIRGAWRRVRVGWRRRRGGCRRRRGESGERGRLGGGTAGGGGMAGSSAAGHGGGAGSGGGSSGCGCQTSGSGSGPSRSGSSRLGSWSSSGAATPVASRLHRHRQSQIES